MPAEVPIEIRRRLEEVQAVASLPHEAAELLALLRSREVDLHRLGEAIEHNPSLAAKLLKVANSAAWGLSGRVDSVQRALVLLGLQQVTNLVMAVSLYSTFARVEPNPWFDRRRFWLHSVGSAQIARALTGRLGLDLKGEDFLAALLHDLGRMLLDQFAGETFVEIARRAVEQGRPLREVEQEVLGCDHADLGGWLLTRWRLPEAITAAVACHHRPEDAPPEHRALAAVVHVADLLCEMWGIGFDCDASAAELGSTPAWRILVGVVPALESLDLERFTFELEEQVAGARDLMEMVEEVPA